MTILKDATKALEYLILDPDEKINYRESRDLSMEDWYANFSPDIIESEFLSKNHLLNELNLKSTTYTRLNKFGYFGNNSSTNPGKLISTNLINKALLLTSKLVPVTAIYEIVENNKWYLSRQSINQLYGGITTKGIFDRGKRFLSLTNTAKLTRDLRERKNLIEKGKTLEDLNRESGLNLSHKKMKDRYLKMRRNNEIKFHQINNYSKNGEYLQDKVLDLISPTEYPRILEKEKQLCHKIESGKDAKNLAAILEISYSQAAGIIRSGVELGIFNPIDDLTYCGVGERRVIPLEEITSVIEGKVVLPDNSYLSKLKKTLTNEEYICRLKDEKEFALARSNSFTIKMIAEETGSSLSAIQNRVKFAIEHGFIKPISKNLTTTVHLSEIDKDFLIKSKLMHLKKWNNFKKISHLVNNNSDSNLFSYISNIYDNITKEVNFYGFKPSFSEKRDIFTDSLIYFVQQDFDGKYDDAICHKVIKNKISSILETRLLEKIQSDKPESFNIIHQLYQTDINRISSKYRSKTSNTREEGEQVLMSLLFEIIAENEGHILHDNMVSKLEEKYRKSMRNERITMYSIFNPIGENIRFQDLIDENRISWS